jgi:YD repeat-containing protein
MDTYLTDTNYTSRYIFNRLLTATVTDGTYTTTLASNYYDNNSTGVSACGAYTLSAITSNEHDNTNYGTSFLYRGNPHYTATPGGTKCLSYDAGGNLLTHNNNGLTTTATVNSTTNYAAPSQITTNSLSGTTNYTAALGLTSASGPNGDTASILYDPNNRPSTTTSPYGAQTTYTYNDSASPPNKIATTNGHWVKTSMDGFGRTIKTETGNGSTTVSVVDTQYVPCGCSPLGKVGQVSQPYAPGGTVYWTVYHYYGLGRTTSVVAPDGSTATYAYSGNTVTVTDPANKYKNFFTDALGNLYQVQEPDPTLGLVSTTYTYDILNHLITVMGIARQILEHALRSAERRLDVHHPRRRGYT